MMTRKLAIALILAAALAAQTGETYKARLSAVAADARTRPALAGSGSATATLSGSKLTISGSFQGLLSPATSAQLHAAIAGGVRGPVIQDLYIPMATAGMISGSVDLTSGRAWPPTGRSGQRDFPPTPTAPRPANEPVSVVA